MTNKFPNPNLKLSKKFKELFGKLPSEELIQFIKTKDQLERWLLIHETNNLLVDCLTSRFNKEDDPISDLKNTKEGKILHHAIWQSVNTYESLWALIQLSFQGIKQICEKEKISLPFKKAWDLFAEIVRYRENSAFKQHYLQESSQPIHLSNDTKAAKLIRKSVWENLSLAEISELKKLVKNQPEEYWFTLVISCCFVLSQRDKLIEKHYNDFRSNIASIMDLDIRMISNSSKGRLPTKIASEYWIDGTKYTGQKKGGMYSHP